MCRNASSLPETEEEGDEEGERARAVASYCQLQLRLERSNKKKR